MGEDKTPTKARQTRKRVTQACKTRRALFVVLMCLTLFGSGVYLGLTSFRRQPSAGRLAGIPDPGTQDYSGSLSVNGDTSMDFVWAGAEQQDFQKDDFNSTGQGESRAPATEEGSSEIYEALVIRLSDLAWPSSGEIKSEPGWYYSENLKDWRYFPGVTIAGDTGRDVCAAFPGVVNEVADDPINGKTIVLSHGTNLETRYSGIRLALRSPGDEVHQGEAIARLQGGNLLFQLFRDGEALNPANYLGRGR